MINFDNLLPNFDIIVNTSITRIQQQIINSVNRPIFQLNDLSSQLDLLKGKNTTATNVILQSCNNQLNKNLTSLSSNLFGVDALQQLSKIKLLSLPPSFWSEVNISDDNKYDTYNTDEIELSKKTDEIIISKIISPDIELNPKLVTDNTAIITATPVISEVIDYIAQNPNIMYQLTPREFEMFIAEFYTKLGYKAECTKETRDGGKDIILSQKNHAGNFVYYVECKKYSPKNHIGVGVIRNFQSVMANDHVNGGFVATTSFFTKDSRKYIQDNNLQYMFHLHDFNYISSTLEGFQQ